jgi:hypothetical protein
MEAQAQEQAAAQAATTLLSEPELEPELQPSSKAKEDDDSSSNIALTVENQLPPQALRHIPEGNKGIGQQKGGGGDVTSGRPATAAGSGSGLLPSIKLPGHGRNGEEEQTQPQNEFGFEYSDGGLGVASDSRGSIGISTNRSEVTPTGYEVTLIGEEVTPTEYEVTLIGEEVTPAGGDYVTPTEYEVTPDKDGRLGVTSYSSEVTPSGDANVTLSRKVTPTGDGEVTSISQDVTLTRKVTPSGDANVTSTSYLYYAQFGEGNIVPALAAPEAGQGAGTEEEVTVTDFDLQPTARGLRTALVMLCNYYTAWRIEDPLLTEVKNILYSFETGNGTDQEQNQPSQAAPVSEPELEIELVAAPVPEITEPEPTIQIESEIESGDEDEIKEPSLEPIRKENEWEALLPLATDGEENEAKVEAPEPEIVEVPEVTNPSLSPTASNVTLTPTPTPTPMLPSPTPTEQDLDLGTAADDHANADGTTDEGNKELEPLSEGEAEAKVTLPVALTTSEGNINNDSSSTSADSESSVGNADGADDATDGEGEGDVTPDVDDGSSSSSSNNGSSARQFVLALLARPENKGGLASNVLNKICVEQSKVTTAKYLKKTLSKLKSEGLIAQHGHGKPYFLVEAEAEAEADTTSSASEMATVITA